MTRMVIKPSAAWWMVRELLRSRRGMIKQVSPAAHRACTIIGYSRLLSDPDKYRVLFTKAYKLAIELEEIEEQEAQQIEREAHARREARRQ